MAPNGRARAGVGALFRVLGRLTDERLAARETAADLAIRTMGITFSVYHEQSVDAIDREWPFDIIPRLIRKTEWDAIGGGLTQRVKALNLFIDDVYHEQHALRDGVVPRDYVARSREFRPECVGVDIPHGVWSHVCGSDLVRDEKGIVYVLEDNVRVPSGVSYMLENRAVMKRVFPELFEHYAIHPVDDYPRQLRSCLASLSPRDVAQPKIVVLTPGIYNSAYFEHSYLAQLMGAELVEGSDLVVDRDDHVLHAHPSSCPARTPMSRWADSRAWHCRRARWWSTRRREAAARTPGWWTGERMKLQTLSRVAERIYWMGRYVERAESTARLISVHADLLMDLPVRRPLDWRVLLDITGSNARALRRRQRRRAVRADPVAGRVAFAVRAAELPGVDAGSRGRSCRPGVPVQERRTAALVCQLPAIAEVWPAPTAA